MFKFKNSFLVNILNKMIILIILSIKFTFNRTLTIFMRRHFNFVFKLLFKLTLLLISTTHQHKCVLNQLCRNLKI